jgi:hypothetical protein
VTNPLDKKLVQYDPDSKSGLQFLHDSGTGESAVRQVQETTPILEANLEARNQPHFRRNGEEFRRVASIPMVVYNDLVRQGITKDPAALKRWLNDANNRAFRTNRETI